MILFVRLVLLLDLVGGLRRQACQVNAVSSAYIVRNLNVLKPCFFFSSLCAVLYLQVDKRAITDVNNAFR